MASEWYITILNDPQGFWKLLQHYLTAPFTGSSTDTAILSEFLDTLLNHPLWLVIIVLFVLLLGGSLLASGIAVTSETRREKKEQMERQLAKHEQHKATQSTFYISTLLEREECGQTWTTQD